MVLAEHILVVEDVVVADPDRGSIVVGMVVGEDNTDLVEEESLEHWFVDLGECFVEYSVFFFFFCREGMNVSKYG